MANEIYEFNPVSSITVGALELPGQQAFFLQASQGMHTITLRLEREQVLALYRGIEEILKDLEQREIRPVSSREEPELSELTLQEPLEAAFAAGHMGLAFDQAVDMMVLFVQELADDEGGARSFAHFWASLGQMRALSRLAKGIVASGWPICPLCQQPIDPEGHFCPRGNGHDDGTQPD